LKIAGRDLDVDAYVERGVLVPVGVYRRGEARFPTLPRARKNTQSGFGVVVSKKAGSDFAELAKDALSFLGRHRRAVRALKRRQGVETATLDFRLERPPRGLVEGLVFPEGLVRLAGELGLGLELSFYPAADPAPATPET
jgi:hypothetical protein